MEKGTKPLSDNVLLKIEDTFEINLDGYKKKAKNKLGRYLPVEKVESTALSDREIVQETDKIEQLLSHVHPSGSAQLKKKYTGLIGKRHEADNRFMEEDELLITQEELALENNLLLKELVIGMRELILLVKNQS